MAKQHSRIEARAYYIKNADELGKAGEKWPDLTTVGMVISYRHVKGQKPQLSIRYYISSASLTESTFAQSVRKHWLVENSLHYVLDVSKSEDKSQIYPDNGAENWAILRQMSLNMQTKQDRQINWPVCWKLMPLLHLKIHVIVFLNVP